jgi:diaminopimelate epimerase
LILSKSKNLDRQFLHFAKYEGAGNDFVIVDAMESSIYLSLAQIQQICNRHFGVGADGLIFIRPSNDADYEMVYHNADGDVGSMCGNGARCAFNFARLKGYAGETARFIAYDGVHTARVLEGDWVEVSMSDVSMSDVSMSENGKSDGGTTSEVTGDCTLDTGSPHYVRFVPDLADLDIVEEGRRVRYSETYRNNGINVNFVEVYADFLRFKTYERGVEDRTLACGTGATAVALAYADKEGLLEGPVALKADGGDLVVNFQRADDGFTNIVLQGPAREVFIGTIGLEPAPHE